jgi:hypothetical protein
MTEDKDTRYYIDLDLKTKSIIGWNYGQRQELIKQESADSSQVRIYITKGQYKKLI